MAKQDISQYKEEDLVKLIDNRWGSSSEVWDTIAKLYKQNTAIYENRAEWLGSIPEKRRRNIVQANRVFVNMEAVINSLIANPPGINILPARDGEEAQDFARRLETYLRKKYTDLNVKETLRMGLRNLYFARLLVLKPYWNPAINDFDIRAIDPRNIRVGKYARKEQESEFVIEEIEDNLCAVCQRFPLKKEELKKKMGMLSEEELYIKNPDIKYQEAWIADYVIFKYQNIILGKIKNPYWDWDGILVTEEEEQQLNDQSEETGLNTEARRQLLTQVKLQQDQRKQELALSQAAQQPQPVVEGVAQSVAPVEGEEQYLEPTQGGTVGEDYPAPNPDYRPYFFNYFDEPRKPYIFATIFNNENTPIGRTDMITLSADLQHGIDKRKMDIDENCEFMNGILKVDSSVMDKANAQKIRFETKGVVFGKGVKDGVTREVGQPLPQMVFDDMVDSRNEIDNIMAATSAFRGEREGQETKAGRLALIQQSYLRLNELVQVVDFVSGEAFSWFYQLAKTRYTEYHYAKWMGKEEARETIELIQDDFENGSEVTIIAGKSLPRDDEFKFEQAQNDVQQGFISPADYLKIAQYDDPGELARNAVLYKQNPAAAVGLAPEEMPMPAQPGTVQPSQAQAMADALMQPAPAQITPEGVPVQ